MDAAADGYDFTFLVVEVKPELSKRQYAAALEQLEEYLESILHKAAENDWETHLDLGNTDMWPTVWGLLVTSDTVDCYSAKLRTKADGREEVVIRRIRGGRSQELHQLLPLLERVKANLRKLEANVDFEEELETDR